MKVVILAAGQGTRLGEGGGPKPLTTLANGKSILEMQLENFTKYISNNDIYIVVGYQKEMVMSYFPDVTFIDNPAFAEENTAKSLLRAFQHFDDDVIWINGDVVFHDDILDNILQATESSMVVNIGDVGDEEVKYRTDEKGRIIEVSKNVQFPEGEALGINVFLKDDLAKLKHNLEVCDNQDYFEKGIEASIQQGLKILPLVVKQEDCVEIDFPEDVLKANRLISSWDL
ncbi:MAG: phosphocholine cytidylyltransferase family protein [Chlamydiota bacterium]|nr:phosphocholine cytidylyltransferase family protein [Chlamydiota bacterium]